MQYNGNDHGIERMVSLLRMVRRQQSLIEGYCEQIRQLTTGNA